MDFDGVLNNDPFLRHQRNHLEPSEHALFDPQNAQCLDQLCQRLPVSSIVITSTWRSGRSIDGLRSLMAAEGASCAGLVCDKTLEMSSRTQEIMAHVAQNPAHRWFALDDMVLDGLPTGRFYRVRPSTGLTIADLDAIERFLLA